MDKKIVEKISSRDFFSIKNNFEKSKDVNSKLIYGNHYINSPFVTIIICTYKRKDLLWLSIESAINQVEFDDYQILIVDDYPQSNEIEVIKELNKFNTDKIIYYQNDENLGQFANRNRGAELSQSEWICFLDDDDLLCNFHLKMMYGILNKNNNIDHLGTSKIVKYGGGMYNNIYNRYDESKIFKYIPFNIFTYNFGYDTEWAGGFIRKSFFMGLGGFDIDCSLMEDYVMAIKSAYYGNTFRCITPTYIYRLMSNISMTSIWQEQCTWEYFLFRAISQKHNYLFRIFCEYKCKYFILEKVKYLNDANCNYLKKSANISEQELIRDCNIKLKKSKCMEFINNYICKSITFINKIILRIKYKEYY